MLATAFPVSLVLMVMLTTTKGYGLDNKRSTNAIGICGAIVFVDFAARARHFHRRSISLALERTTEEATSARQRRGTAR